MAIRRLKAIFAVLAVLVVMVSNTAPVMAQDHGQIASGPCTGAGSGVTTSPATPFMTGNRPAATGNRLVVIGNLSTNN